MVQPRPEVAEDEHDGAVVLRDASLGGSQPRGEGSIRRLLVNLDGVEEAPARRVLHREREARSARREGRAAGVDMELVVDERSHPVDRYPVWSGADRLCGEVVLKDREHDVAVRVGDDVEPEVEPGALREAVGGAKQDAAVGRDPAPFDDWALAQTIWCGSSSERPRR